MINYKEKLDSLGGIDSHPLCENEDYVNAQDIFNLEKKLQVNLPKEIKEFGTLFGSFSFYTEVAVRGKETPPVTKEGEPVPVSYFFSLKLDGECSVWYNYESREEVLPKGLIPFAEGELGDLICINTNKVNFGKIYYWFHEDWEDGNVYLLFDNFVNFVKNLKVIEI